MAIDGCGHRFSKLAENILPKHMRKMRSALRNPEEVSLFDISGNGPKTIALELGYTDDFSGCYVFLRERKPYYVGISRSVIRRIRSHVKGTTHFDASLAYQMAVSRSAAPGRRDENMKSPRFRKAFTNAKLYLRRSEAAMIEIENDLELHFFEGYCAMKLDTSEWNSFRTH